MTTGRESLVSGLTAAERLRMREQFGSLKQADVEAQRGYEDGLGGHPPMEGRPDNLSGTFSPCRTWRYSLTRSIPDPAFGCNGADDVGGTLTFVGLNPSTADETTDDPTIRRCVRFARDWGFDRLKMVNLYAYRATNPHDLWTADDPVGPENDHNLSLAFGGSDRIVVAWGSNAQARRLEQFEATFRGWQFWALGLTKDGFPRHPLYMRADVQPFIYDLGARRAA